MLRFTMPDPSLPLPERKATLKEQFDAFLRSEALRELFSLLGVDRDRFAAAYNGRLAGDGTVRETQELTAPAALNERRRELYPLLRELGFFTINTPLEAEYDRVLVLGGSLDACFSRTRCAARWAGVSTRAVDGLACYRPIHPVERESSAFFSACDTEFGAMRDSFAEAFRLSASSGREEFAGDRNLNAVSCVFTFPETENGRVYRVLAAPSTQPELRRADTGDSLLYYLRKTPLEPGERLLAVTHNRYCNRQFAQIAYLFMKEETPLGLDVVGCVPDESIVPADRYDPFQFLQDLIGLMDWAERFGKEL